MGHSTLTRIKRGAAVGAGVLAVSLASALPANAALGNAKPGAATLTPNLVSVSVAGSQATYRFDRQLSDIATNATQFTLTSNALGNIAGTAAQVNGSTVTVGFAAGQDLTKFVAGGVSAGQVQTLNQAGRVNAFSDNAPITTTDSKDGTRGFSAAPKLVSVERESSTVLVYVFDREVVAGANAANFTVSDAGTGTPVAGNSATTEANRVKVTFTNGTTALNNAQSASTLNNAVTSATPVGPGGSGQSAISRVALPGKSEVTGRADLVSATLVPASFGFTQTTSVEYTFDDAVTPAAAAGTGFQLLLANGARLAPVSTSQDPTTPTKIIVNFGVGATLGEQEYAVAAIAGAGAAQSQGAVASTASDADIGGNAGASASGFTVAPEVLAVTKANTNQVNVVVDTRLTAAPGPIQLRTAEGTILATPTLGSAAAAYQETPGVKTLIYNVPGSANVTDAVTAVFPAGTFVSKLGASLPQVVGF